MGEEKQVLSESEELRAAVILLLRVAALVCLAALCWHLSGYHFVLTAVAWTLMLVVAIYAFAGAVLASAVLRNIVARWFSVPNRKWVMAGLNVVVLTLVFAIFGAEFWILTRTHN